MIIVYNGWIKYEINSSSVNHETKLINLEVKTMFLKLKNVYKKEFVQSITSIEYWCTMLFTSNSLNRVLIFQSALISLEFNETQKVLLESEINDSVTAKLYSTRRLLIWLRWNHSFLVSSSLVTASIWSTLA